MDADHVQPYAYHILDPSNHPDMWRLQPLKPRFTPGQHNVLSMVLRHRTPSTVLRLIGLC